MERRVLLASPRGFCLGVARAVEMLEDTLEQEEGTVYVRKEIVHNAVLVNHFKSLGVVIVGEVDEVPSGSLVVFSAHGVAPSVRERARERNLRVVDTTCSLVKKVHNAAIRFKEQGYSIILIGEHGHKEVIGVTGEAPEHIQVIQSESEIDKLTGIDESHVAWLTQTTLNVDDTQQIIERLRVKYPLIQDPPQACICYATRERQLAVKNIANACDLFIVVGSANSANTIRLTEVASEAGATDVVRVDMPEELDDIDFSTVGTIGVTSGVSTTEEQLRSILDKLRKFGYPSAEEDVAVFEKKSFNKLS